MARSPAQAQLPFSAAPTHLPKDGTCHNGLGSQMLEAIVPQASASRRLWAVLAGGQGGDGGLSAVLVVWWPCSWCFAFIIPGEGGESDGRWAHSAVSQAPAEHGAVCTVLSGMNLCFRLTG